MCSILAGGDICGACGYPHSSQTMTGRKEGECQVIGKKLPIGIQGFEKLRTDGFLYVDKTEYIYRLVHDNVPYFLSRPSIGREYTLAFPNEEVKYGFVECLMPEYVADCGAGSGNMRESINE